MRRLAPLLVIPAFIANVGCMDSSVVLYVSPDGHGRAVLTTRVYEAGLRAFDALVPGAFTPASLEQELPPPDENSLASTLGTRFRLASSKFERTSDGAVRTTVAEFRDITELRLPFPPIFGMGAMSHIEVPGLDGEAVITFAIKPHENGDRLLLARFPDGQVHPDADPQMTVLKTDSPEERAIKAATKRMALRLAVEMEEVTLLRTNAPASSGNRATVLDLDLEKIVGGLDEEKMRRAMLPGSLQEVLWQLGDMPGAVVPKEREVFLEFEPPQVLQTAQPAAAPPAQQAPPDTEIYLAPLRSVNGTLEVGPAVNVTNSPGYDNQPFFTPDGRALLFTSVRGGGTQTDIYRVAVPPGPAPVQVTRTPESEYSPTVTPSGALSVIRVELDGNNTQRLWQFTIDGGDPRVVLEQLKPVGYHAWADDKTLALFVLGQPATLQTADATTGAARVIASDIGRSIQVIPGGTSPRDISFVPRERSGETVRLLIKKVNPRTGEISLLTPAVEGGTEADTAWTPDGTLLMVRGSTLYGWRAGQSGWKEIASLERLSLRGVTRLAVSPKGDYLALVGSAR
jgi:hypothetical protein